MRQEDPEKEEVSPVPPTGQAQLGHGKGSGKKNTIPSCDYGVGIHHKGKEQGASEAHILPLLQPGLGHQPHLNQSRRTSKQLAGGLPNGDHVSVSGPVN